MCRASQSILGQITMLSSSGKTAGSRKRAPVSASIFPNVILTLILFVVLPCYTAYAQTSVIKEVCLTPFGMPWQTVEDAQTHLVARAKREAVGELFGAMIQSLTRVQNFQLKKDDITAFSIDSMRLKGKPEFTNGKSFGEVCAKLNAYITDEDKIPFYSHPVERRVCIADPRLSRGEVLQVAERQARIHAVRDFGPKLHYIRDKIVLALIHESTTIKEKFIDDTRTQCVRSKGIIYPIELLFFQSRSQNRIAGKWSARWGPLDLQVRGSRVWGTYNPGLFTTGTIEATTSADGKTILGIWTQSDGRAGIVEFNVDVKGDITGGKYGEGSALPSINWPVSGRMKEE